MAHRSDRDRERDRGGDRDRDRDRRRERDRDSGRDSIRERDPPRSSRGDLNEFFVDGAGIHREVMQREICKYLGPEAYSRPGTFNGIKGYIVTAVRPFTPKMIEDLQNLSEDYMAENQQMRLRGYQEIPYKDSVASRRQDPSMTSDHYSQDARFVQQPVYSSAISQPGYPTTAGGYPPGPSYPPSSVPGYPPTSGYPQQGPAYSQSSGYSSQAIYPLQGAGYPPASGYTAAGYPATAGRPENPNDMNYTYADQTGEYSSQGYPYRQVGGYAGGAQASHPRAAAGYPYVTSPQDVAMRGSAIDERYDSYGQSIPAGRGGFPPPSRGTPTGYDPPPQPRDGYAREPIRDERRRR